MHMRSHARQRQRPLRSAGPPRRPVDGASLARGADRLRAGRRPQRACGSWPTAGSTRSTPARPTASPTSGSAGCRSRPLSGMPACSSASLVAAGAGGRRSAGGTRRRCVVLLAGVRLDRADRRHHLPEPLLVRDPGRRCSMVVAPMDAALSLDARRSAGGADRRVAVGWVWLLRFQVAVVYVFAGLAKLQADWLVRRAARCGCGCPARAGLPVVGPLLAEPATAHVLQLGRAPLFDCLDRRRCCCGGGPGCCAWVGGRRLPRGHVDRCSRSACSRG